MGDNTVPLVLFPPLFLSILTIFSAKALFLNFILGRFGFVQGWQPGDRHNFQLLFMGLCHRAGLHHWRAGKKRTL
jgi:hypothetical protein